VVVTLDAVWHPLLLLAPDSNRFIKSARLVDRAKYASPPADVPKLIVPLILLPVEWM
jgi:hypothetical protein